MSPTWYDVLGVEPDASTDEIKAAWRALVAELGPTDRRFASLNEAASTLLDADKRAAYDASLTPSEPVANPSPEESTKPAKKARAAQKGPVTQDMIAEDTVSEADPATEPEAEAGEARAPVTLIVGEPKTPLKDRVVTALARPVALVVAVVLAVALVVAAILVHALRDKGPAVSQSTVTVHQTDQLSIQVQKTAARALAVRVDGSLQDADSAGAIAAAEADFPILLARNYHTVDKQLALMKPLVTPEYYKSLTPYMQELVAPDSKKRQEVVTLDPILDAGIVRTAPGVVEVLLLVDSRSSYPQGTVVTQTWADVTMTRVNGTWLVSNITTAPIPKS